MNIKVRVLAFFFILFSTNVFAGKHRKVRPVTADAMRQTRLIMTNSAERRRFILDVARNTVTNLCGDRERLILHRNMWLSVVELCPVEDQREIVQAIQDKTFDLGVQAVILGEWPIKKAVDGLRKMLEVSLAGLEDRISDDVSLKAQIVHLNDDIVHMFCSVIKFYIDSENDDVIGEGVMLLFDFISKNAPPITLLSPALELYAETEVQGKAVYDFLIRVHGGLVEFIRINSIKISPKVCGDAVDRLAVFLDRAFTGISGGDGAGSRVPSYEKSGEMDFDGDAGISRDM